MTTTTTTITVTPATTVQALLDAGLSLASLQSLVNAAASGVSGASSSRKEFAEEVYAILVASPSTEWKNGDVLKTWYPGGKSSDAEVEKARVKRHQEIGRALADLAAEGRLVKECKGDSASGTFYKVVESKMPVAQAQAEDISTEVEVVPGMFFSTDSMSTEDVDAAKARGGRTRVRKAK